MKFYDLDRNEHRTSVGAFYTNIKKIGSMVYNKFRRKMPKNDKYSDANIMDAEVVFDPDYPNLYDDEFASKSEGPIIDTDTDKE